jgi:hypothetical protein
MPVAGAPVRTEATVGQLRERVLTTVAADPGLNGIQVSQFQNSDPGRGLATTPAAPSYFGLQAHTGRVACRFQKPRDRAMFVS